MGVYEALASMDSEQLVAYNLNLQSLRLDTDINFGLKLFYATIDGTLELNGATRPTTLSFMINGEGKACVLACKMSII